MKCFYLFITLILLVFTGCSSIYSVKDFPSKEELYNSFNNFAKDKKLDIKFKGDSTITVNDGAVIMNDTLFALGYSLDKKYGRAALSGIEKINYTSSDYKSAVLTLNNGKVIKADEITVANDTMEYSVTRKIPAQTKVGVISALKEASYKNHWLGIPPRFFMGTATGFVVGLSIASAYNDNTQSGQNKADEYIISFPFLGAVIGIVWGWIDGYTYVYKFNQ